LLHKHDVGFPPSPPVDRPATVVTTSAKCIELSVGTPIVTKSALSLKSNQYTTYVTFGLLSWLDVSAVIPIVNVSMGIQTTCSICFQSQPTAGVTLVFTPNTATANATGIGDVRFRVKVALIQGERTSLAVGWDVRTPTGNDLNFLGTGTVGFRPFGSFAYRSRIAPHASVGYTANGSSNFGFEHASGKRSTAKFAVLCNRCGY